MGLRFEHDREYEEVIETAAGAFWVAASVSIRQAELELNEFLLYPVTATRVPPVTPRSAMCFAISKSLRVKMVSRHAL